MGLLDYFSTGGADQQKMKGLLGADFEDPRTMAALNMAAQLLEAGGPSTQKIGLGQALGRGMQGYTTGMKAGTDMRNDKTKLGIMERQAMAKEDRRKLVSRYNPQTGQTEQVWLEPGQTDGPVAGLEAPKLPEWQTMGPDGRPMINPEYVAMKQQLAQQGADAQPYSTPLSTTRGIFNYDHRTKQVSPATYEGKPLVGAQFDPSLQGQLAREKKAGSNTADQVAVSDKQSKGGESLLAAAREARALLQAGTTGSAVGALVDKGMGAVGASTESARNAKRLETIAGWMVSNVPRMEGPQSDFDVKNYQTMAAAVGDRWAPVAERMAALDTLEGLHKKYEGINQEYREKAQGGGGQNQQQAPKTSGGGWSAVRVK